jgi:hypothetical protein
MIPSTNNKRGARRARQNKTPIKVISMTQTEAFEANLSRSSDATVLRGKFLLNPTPTAVPSNILSLSPANVSMGGRLNQLALSFSRYRFKYLKFRFLTANVVPASFSGQVALGVVDDGVATTSDTPTTASGVMELRCSGTAFVNQTVPTTFEWSPADKEFWYYTTPDAIDARFLNSGLLFIASTSTGGAPITDIEVDYCCVFKGAVDASAI